MEAAHIGSPQLCLGDERTSVGLLLGAALSSFFSIAAMQVLLILAFVSWIIGLLRPESVAPRGPLLPLMFAYVLASVVSAVLVPDAYSAKKALSGGLPMLAYWMGLNLMTEVRRLQRAALWVVVGGVFASLLGLAQDITQDGSFRVSGTLSHYMTYSGVLMVAGAVALARATFVLSGKQRLGWLAALVPILAALLLTETRGAWVGFAGAAAVVLGLRKARLLLLLPVALVGLYCASPEHVQERIRSTVDASDTTTNQRLSMWSVGGQMIAEAPVLGVGPRQIGANYDRFRSTDDPFRSKSTPGHLHNNVVEIGASRGLLGLFLWLAFWGAWFFRSGRILSGLHGGPSEQRTAVVSALAALTAFQIMGIFEYNAGDSEVVTLAMFIMAFPFAVEGLERNARPAGAEPELVS